MTLATLPTRVRPTVPSSLGRALVWLNVLCLLEPTIAVVWQALLARSTGANLAVHHAPLLWASLWLVYAADRWLDGLRRERPSTLRHAFFSRHRVPLAVLWTALLLASLTLASATLRPLEWGLGSALISLVAAYLYAVHQGRLRAGAKKAAVALVYALGVGLFVWPSTSDPGWLLALQLGLAGLAGGNLLAISTFERETPARKRQPAALCCVVIGGVLGSVALAFPAGPSEALVGSAGSALALAALLALPGRPVAEVIHALCDLALLVTLSAWL